MTLQGVIRLLQWIHGDNQVVTFFAFKGKEKGRGIAGTVCTYVCVAIEYFFISFALQTCVYFDGCNRN